MIQINLLPVEMRPSALKGTTKYSNAGVAAMTAAKIGKPCSAATREKIRQNLIPWCKGQNKDTNPTLAAAGKKISAAKMGIPRSEETKAKIRVARALQARRPCSEETKRKIAAANRGRKASAECRENIRIARSKQIVPVMHTKIELEIQSILDDLGVTYKSNSTIVGLKSVLGWYHQFDATLYDYKLVIEADGCYWHCCALCYASKPIKHPKGSPEFIRARDKQIDIAAQTFGWRILRIPEHMFKSLDDVRQLIANTLKA